MFRFSIGCVLPCKQSSAKMGIVAAAAGKIDESGTSARESGFRLAESSELESRTGNSDLDSSGSSGLGSNGSTIIPASDGGFCCGSLKVDTSFPPEAKKVSGATSRRSGGKESGLPTATAGKTRSKRKRMVRKHDLNTSLLVC